LLDEVREVRREVGLLLAHRARVVDDEQDVEQVARAVGRVAAAGMTSVSSDGRSSFISPVGLPLIEPSVAGSVGFVAGVMPTDTLLVLSSSPPLLSPQPAWASNTAVSARDAHSGGSF
jgi:hypothetical protein